ncbi:radical SAM protein [Sulfurihydrogenibium azorense]|uniref:radical SAM protein n=1 Tax=Sulfurihydrogenibium azorense TaxID=309806 RepID=UPI0039192E51
MFRLSNIIKSTFEEEKERTLDGTIAIWNFTNRCNLSCLHCYSKATVDSRDTLSTDEIVKTLDSMVKAGIKFIIFSGGEPLLRKDIFDTAQECKKRGIFTYLSTNGIYIDDKNLDNVVNNFNYVGVSIDGEPDIHDKFRGMKGSYQKSFEAVLKLMGKTEKVGIRFTLTKETVKSLKFIFNLVEKYRIPKLYISHLVYSGRGLENQNMDLSKKDRRRIVNFILDKAFFYYKSKRKTEIVTGNMEQDAIMLLQRFIKNYPDLVEKLYERLVRWGGNSAGVKLVNIDSFGNIKPDPFFPFSLGNIKEREFYEIWNDNNNPILNFLRTKPRPIEGKCKKCVFLNVCNGGSRSRAFSVYGDLSAEDPSCYLSDKEIRSFI